MKLVIFLINYPWLTHKVLTANIPDLIESGQQISLVLDSPAGRNIQFNADGIERLVQPGQMAYLVDQVTGKSWDLISRPTFGVDIQQPTTTFALLIGSEEFVTNAAESYLPERFTLEKNYPNPFVNSTQIGYSLPASEMVILEIYDVLGRRITTLVNHHQEAGYYSVDWNPDTSLSNGVYFYRLSAGGFVQTNKMILVR